MPWMLRRDGWLVSSSVIWCVAGRSDLCISASSAELSASNGAWLSVASPLQVQRRWESAQLHILDII